MEPTQAYLKELFDYHEDGHLLWKVKKSKNIIVGSIAGCVTVSKRYNIKKVAIRVDKRLYLAHRLVWIWHFGKIEKPEIDHKDGNPLNNKISNLRQATHAENGKNMKKPVTNTSGVKGVYFNKNKKWQAYINILGKRENIGSFDDINDAKKARLEAEKKYYGDWRRI